MQVVEVQAGKIEVLALMLAPLSRSPQISPGHKTKQAGSYTAWVQVYRRLHLGPVKELVCRKGRIEVDLHCRKSSQAWA